MQHYKCNVFFCFCLRNGTKGFPRHLSIIGLKAARARGRMGGRPKKNAAVIKDALAMYDSKRYTLAEIHERTGVGKATLYAYINARKA